MTISAGSQRERTISPIAAACALLDDASGLAAWPGPAFVLDRRGATAAASDAAGPLLTPIPDASLVAAVVRGRPATVAVTLIAGGDARRFDCAVMPLEPGESALILARDTTLEAALRDALVDSRQRYKDLVEISGDFCWETGADGRFAFVSPQGAAGWRAEAMIGRDPASFVEGPRSADASLPFAARVHVLEVDVWFRRADGDVACLATSAMPLFDRDGLWSGARGLCRDVTEARNRDAARASAGLRERLLAHVAHAVRDEIEPARMIAAAAAATARALDADDCRIVVLADAPRADTERRDPDSDDAIIARAIDTGGPADADDPGRRVLAVGTVFRGRTNGAVVVERRGAAAPWSVADRALAGDVAAQIGIALAQIDRERRLEALSRTDPLTGLLNRRAFEAELGRRLDRNVIASAPGALVYVDLDNFKAVNDIHGHGRGDEALCAVARLLLRSTRPGDLVARLGGDEFALWLERTDMATTARRAADLTESARALAAFSGEPARPFGFSVGAAVFAPGSDETLAALAARADRAMYTVKRDGKGGFAIAPACAAESISAAERASA